jgi:transglutaminase-like putative cysteine protease
VSTETQELNTFYQPGFRSPYPDPQHQRIRPATRKSSKRHFSLAPGEGWLVMLLLTIAVYSVVFSIISANWVSSSYILLLSTAIGLLLGLCVAKVQHFPQAILHLAAVLVGHWLSVWLTSVFAFHISWLLLLKDLSSVITGGFTTTTPVNNEMVFLFYLTFLSYFLGYFGAWLIYRAHLPWLVALVYCAIMLVNLNYIKQDLTYLVIIMLGALILLLARMQLVNQLAQWTHEGLYTDHVWLQNITRQFTQIGAFFMLLILLIALISPVLAQPASGNDFWNNLDNAWTNITHGQVSLSNPATLFQSSQPDTNFFGDYLSISGNVNLPSGDVLSYTSTPRSLPQYLVGFTYDNFDGHTWTSSSNESRLFGNDVQLFPVDGPGNFDQVVTSVTIVDPPGGAKHYLYGPMQPASFSVPTNLYENGLTTAWTQKNPLTPGESYQVTSNISTATEEELSAVPFPQDNPNLWSHDRNISIMNQFYFERPSDLPSIVQTTLNQWTGGSTNVYEAMKKLQLHLRGQEREQFRYSVTNPPVPPNVDAVAWLLQTHQGYCTYYATAMTIMARMLGIPARIVNGFSQGHFDLQRKVWVVKGEDAHSWVQVYFPGFGWINFDPTAGFSIPNGPTAQPSPTPVKTLPPVRPTPIATAGQQKPVSKPTPTHGTTGAGRNTTSPGAIVRQNLFLTLSLATLLGSLVIFCFALLFSFKGNKLSATVTASTIYRRVCRLGSLLGSPPQRWQTPYEYYRMLGRRYPQAAAPMRRVTELFVCERWAAPHHAPAPAEEQSLAKLWPQLRNTLIRSFFSHRGM